MTVTLVMNPAPETGFLWAAYKSTKPASHKIGRGERGPWQEFSERETEMPFITFPKHWDETQKHIIPICINDSDSEGGLISSGWIEAVASEADRLRGLARTFLSDVWRASELADESVQALWRVHRDDYGTDPGKRLYVHARWRAMDKRSGGRRARQGFDLELMESLARNLTDRSDWAADYERRQFVDVLKARMDALGLAEEREMVELWLFESTAKELTDRFNKSRNAISKQMWRAVRKSVRLMNR
jgi:DNA-directed RNA polymerase specialized sigma24 family protein